MSLLFGLLFAGGAAAATWLYYQWSARQTERKILRALGDFRLEISPEGLHYTDQEAETRLQWSLAKQDGHVKVEPGGAPLVSWEGGMPFPPAAARQPRA